MSSRTHSLCFASQVRAYFSKWVPDVGCPAIAVLVPRHDAAALLTVTVKLDMVSPRAVWRQHIGLDVSGRHDSVDTEKNWEKCLGLVMILSRRAKLGWRGSDEKHVTILNEQKGCDAGARTTTHGFVCERLWLNAKSRAITTAGDKNIDDCDELC